MTNTESDHTGLVGHFFHSVVDGEVNWQGHIVANPSSDWYIVELFSWMDGCPTVRRLIRIEEMRDWLFYRDSEDMGHSYEYGSAYHMARRAEKRQQAERQAG
jgi:hypothetical protein